MNVLVPVDDSEPAREALEFALAQFPDASITVLHVLDPAATAYGEVAHLGSDGVLEGKRDAAEALFDEFRELAASGDASIATDAVVGQPAPSIVEYVEEHPVDHVVVGSHGRSGVSRVLFGSVAEAVARDSPVPVTVVR